MSEMFKITIVGPRGQDGRSVTTTRHVPALPRIGDHIGIDDMPECSGYVTGVSFYWPEGGDELQIEVRVK
jgi:hypothetical protein